MTSETLQLLNLRRLPGRLNPEETAQLIGCKSYDIPVLVKSKLLKPLGNPPPQAVKYFAAVEIEKNTKDDAWLGRATKAICTHWTVQNRQRKRTNPRESVHVLSE